MTNSIEQQIRDYMQKNFLFSNSYNLSDQDSFLEKGIIDSTGVLELVNFVEETFNIKIKDEEMIPENLDSVCNLAKFITGKNDQNS
jgi:acyl carrier protein